MKTRTGSDRDGASQLCENEGLVLAKWDTADRWFDIIDVAAGTYYIWNLHPWANLTLLSN